MAYYLFTNQHLLKKALMYCIIDTYGTRQTAWRWAGALSWLTA